MHTEDKNDRNHIEEIIAREKDFYITQSTYYNKWIHTKKSNFKT